jgi:hypothetical protein
MAIEVVQIQAVVEVLKDTGIKMSGESLVISWVGEEVQIHACDFAARR